MAMKRPCLSILWLVAASGLMHAFPPAPPHVVHGTLRDEQGNPLREGMAELAFETAGGAVIRASTVSGASPGVNFALVIPMDAGVSGDTYRPDALNPRVPFRIRVRMGRATYLPIQMQGDYHLLGRPGGTTRIDLTLGEDTDRDGLPDAWERVIAARYGWGGNLAAVQPNGDADGDGLSNLDEYLAGTYAFDPADGLELKLLHVDEFGSVAEFLAIGGRTYEVQASPDLAMWTPTAFRLGGGEAIQRFRSLDSKVERVVIPRPSTPTGDGVNPAWFYRVMVR